MYAGQVAVQGMLIDITDRVEAEERFRSLSEASYEALFISEKGVWLEQNMAAEKMFGYTLDETIGRLGTDWIAPEDRDLVMHHMLAGYEEPYRVRALRKDGSTFPAEIVGRMMQYRGRKARVTALRDISGQVKAEESLRESEERYRSLINATPDIICFKDGQGRWLAANDADLALFELTDVDYVGKKDSELAAYSDFYRDAFLTCEDTDENTWRAGTLSRQDEIIPTRNDGDKVYDVIKVPLFNEDGSRQGLVVLGRDITIQVAAQKELKRYARQLEIVNAISSALSTSLALGDLLKAILQQVVQVVSCDSASIFLVETDQTLRIVNAIGHAEVFIGKNFRLEDTLMAKIRPDQKVMIVEDVINDPDYKLWENAQAIHGWMGLLLYAHDALVGYLTFDSQQPQAYSSQDAALAAAFATQVAQAIYNARMYERVIADANDLEKHIQKRTAELQNFVDLTAGREIRMVELKKMIRELRIQLMDAGHVPVAGDALDIA